MEILSFIKTLEQLNKYLNGGTYEDLQDHMNKYNSHWISFHYYFHKMPMNEQAVTKELKRLLVQLNIPQNQWNRYLQEQFTFYGFLEKLNADLEQRGDDQLLSFIQLVDEKRTTRKRGLVIFASAFAMLSLFITLTPGGLETIKNLLQITVHFLQATLVLPVISTLCTSGAAFYNLYQNYFSTRHSYENRMRDNTFLFINATINTIANGFWIAAKATMTPLVAGLFIAASAVQLVKELFIIAQNYYHYHKGPLPLNKDFNADRENLCRENGYRKQLQSSKVNLLFSVLTLGIMAAWCLIPGGIFVTIGAITALAISAQVKASLITRNEVSMREQLQTGLQTLDVLFRDDVGYSNDLAPIHCPALFSKPDHKTCRDRVEPNDLPEDKAIFQEELDLDVTFQKSA